MGQCHVKLHRNMPRSNKFLSRKGHSPLLGAYPSGEGKSTPTPSARGPAQTRDWAGADVLTKRVVVDENRTRRRPAGRGADVQKTGIQSEICPPGFCGVDRQTKGTAPRPRGRRRRRLVILDCRDSTGTMSRAAMPCSARQC